LWTPELQLSTVAEIAAADLSKVVSPSKIPEAVHAAFSKIEMIYTYRTFAFISF
jgi:hypothetical protein